MSSDPKGPETIPLTAEADEHEGHYAWEVEPFDPEGPVGIVISMADVECGQPLDATLVVLADSDDEREVEWARSTADDIAARLNEHQAQAATVADLRTEIERLNAELSIAQGWANLYAPAKESEAQQAREIEGYRQALEKAAKVLASSDGCGNGRYGPICFRLTGDLCSSCSVLVATGVKVIASEECARVLAGKEAQG